MPPARFSHFRKMDCFPEFLEKVRGGWSGGRVAEWLQEEMGERLDVKRMSLTVDVCAFRRDLSAVELVSATNPTFVAAAMKKISASLDELDEIAAIYAIQKERIILAHEAEKKGKVQNKTIGHEVRIAAELLRTSHEIKTDLGVNGPRDLGTITITAKNMRSRYGHSVADVSESPQRVQHVLDAVKQSLAIAQARQNDVIDQVPIPVPKIAEKK